MNTRRIITIVRKDLKVTSQNKTIMVMTIVLTVIFFVVFPWLTALIPLVRESLAGLERVLNQLPANLAKEFSGLSDTQIMTAYILKYMLVPFFLMLPLMVASTIAADSFAGEKERKTMEALLYTPTTDRELFVAKSLSGWLAAMAVTLVGFVLYVIMANAAAWQQLQRIFLPDVMWVVLVLWTVPAIAGVGVGWMVLASSRAQGFQDASQLGGLVLLPLLALFLVQIAGLLFLNVSVVILMGFGMWLLAGLLIWLGSRSFRRGRLLGA